MSASRRPRYHLGRAGRVLFGVYALVLVLFGALAGWVLAMLLALLNRLSEEARFRG